MGLPRRPFQAKNSNPIFRQDETGNPAGLACVFDPLGFLTAVTFRGKSLFQQLWRFSYDWDDEVGEEICRQWSSWVISLSSLGALSIPRLVVPCVESSELQLHLFADASELGFGAVAYARLQDRGGAIVSFIAAKSRVFGLKYLSMPRRELNAAVLAVRLYSAIVSEMDLRFKKIVFWSDSQNVLRWIHSTHCRFQVYVAHRIGEIHEASNPQQWKYVTSLENLADDASRGIDAGCLTIFHRWFRGPTFLRGPQEQWPSLQIQSTPEEDDPEVRTRDWVGATKRVEDEIDKLILRSSRLSKLLRVVAYVLRWVMNARVPSGSRRCDPLGPNDIRSAREFLIRRAQADVFYEELHDLRAGKPLAVDSAIARLNPFLDQRGLICVGGRLRHADIPIETRHPVLLPTKHRVTKLIILSIHLVDVHPTAEQLHHAIRRTYWVPKGRMVARGVVAQCVLCQRMRNGGLQPMMADLPPCRIASSIPAFTNVGVDYFGPIEVIIFRRRVKRWACLFTCLSTRAVHLELSYTLDTDSFLATLIRFESRRGTPAAYYSDNGTNFVGAQGELRECLERLKQKKIVSALSLREVKWTFIPPATPHAGGAWECLVQSAKRALRYILHLRTVTDEVLLTALAQVESLLNNRPLTHVSVDPTDPEPLTPNHFILGRANSNSPPDVVSEEEFDSRKKWRAAQAIATHFWRRWMREYLPGLTERKKWSRPDRNIRVDDIVLIISPQNDRGSRPLGRVVEVSRVQMESSGPHTSGRASGPAQLKRKFCIVRQ